MVISFLLFVGYNFLYYIFHCFSHSYVKIKITKRYKKIFYEPYLFPKEKDVFYYYLDQAHTYFEYGSSGGIHQAAKRGLKIYSAEVGPLWVSYLKKEIKKIDQVLAKPTNITYLYYDLQTKITPTKEDFKQYVTLYDHKKYNADLIYIDGQYHTSCIFHMYNQIDSKTIIIIHDLDKPKLRKDIKSYYKQIQKVGRLFVFQKKDPAPTLTDDIIAKIEEKDFTVGVKIGIETYLRKNLSSVVEHYMKYDNDEMMTKPPKKLAFFLWWQGIETAPPIIKVCLAAVRKNLPDGEVILITKDNISNLVQLPNWIFEKVEKKTLSLNHLSDLLRYTLLSKYGGLWIDATIFTKDQISSEIFDTPYYTIHFDDTYKYVTGKWATFVQASYINNIVTKFISELFLAFLKYHDKVFNYFIADFMMLLGYDYIPSFKRTIQNVPFNNPAVLQMLDHIHDKYSEESYNYLTKDTNFFKITWKSNLKPYIDGQQTVFGYIASKYLHNSSLYNEKL